MEFLKKFFEKLMELFKKTSPAPQIDPPIENISPVKLSVGTPWMAIAIKELGQKEISGSADNPRIVEYHSATTLKATDDETPWCASFINWCLMKVDFPRTKSASAKSYASFGASCKAKYGAIVVIKHSSGPRAGHYHVGFYYAPIDGSHFEMLGGNQGNKVSLNPYPINDIYAIRWPVKS